jgi:hypothetical protein
MVSKALGSVEVKVTPEYGKSHQRAAKIYSVKDKQEA